MLRTVKRTGLPPLSAAFLVPVIPPSRRGQRGIRPVEIALGSVGTLLAFLVQFHARCTINLCLVNMPVPFRSWRRSVLSENYLYAYL